MAARYKLVADPPSGLRYLPDFITEDEEQYLLAKIGELDFKAVVLLGVEAKRTVVPFGFDYAYDFRDVHPIGALPSWLHDLRDRAANVAQLPGENFDQSLVTRYPAGAGIGWHRDAPKFDSTVLGLSLASEAMLRFRRTIDGATQQYVLRLAARSLYVMSGAARWVWQHSLNPTKALRYSITLRCVRRTAKQAADVSSC